MDSVLHPYLGKFIVFFLDDILIYSHSEEEHCEHLRLIFELLCAHKLYAKENKCEFFKTEIHYLGHIITKGGIMMDPEKLEAILHWPHPMNLEELQIFLGLLAGFYHKYIKDYAKLSVLMTDQLKNQGQNFNWGENQQCNFDRLKVAIVFAPILAVVDPCTPFVVKIDAGDKAIGAIFHQDGRPVAFESKKLDRENTTILLMSENCL